MAGWYLKKGILLEREVSEERYWYLFNNVFSGTCRKRSTYKNSLIKSILSNLSNCVEKNKEPYLISYDHIFTTFAENYWNLVSEYKLRQIRKDGKSDCSKIETILINEGADYYSKNVEFKDIDFEKKKRIVTKVKTACKRNVIGALYNDFEGTLYSFDLSGKGIYLHPSAFSFMAKYREELNKRNNYSWANFLEKIDFNFSERAILNKVEG